MSKVNFWISGFIETKRLNIDSFTNENWKKFKCHRSVVSRRKEKSLLLIRYYKQFLIRVSKPVSWATWKMWIRSAITRTLPWVECQIFFEALFICNNINTNLNINFHTLSNRYFYFFKFLREVVWKNSKTKNGPRQGTPIFRFFF